MRKRVQIALAVLLVAIVGVIAWQVLRPKDGEPIYQGKRLSVWLREANGDNTGAADVAVREIGTNAIPTLLKMLRQRDSPLASKLAPWWGRHIAGISRLPDWVRYPDWYKAQAAFPPHEAAVGFQILGADAQQAVPELIRIYEQNVSEQSQYGASLALVAIGPAAKVAIPSFLRAAASSNPRVRIYAVHALSLIRTEPSMVVVELAKSLSDTNIAIRGYAVRGLGEFGTNAQEAAPSLVPLLDDLNDDVRQLATNALKQIDPEAAAKAGVQ